MRPASRRSWAPRRLTSAEPDSLYMQDIIARRVLGRAVPADIAKIIRLRTRPHWQKREVDVAVASLAVYAPGMLTVARVESELDFRFSGDPPVCSVLWLLGDLQDDVMPTLGRIGSGLAPLRCAVAGCASSSRPRPLAGLAGAALLMEATVKFAGRALTDSPSPIVRHESSTGSACEVASVDAEAEGTWQVVASGRGLRRCAALFPGADGVPDGWIYSAARKLMVAGTNVLNRGAPSAMDGLLQNFLADTLQAGGIGVTTGGLELCGPGVALTGTADHIDKAERAVGKAQGADESLVRHSLELAGPWAAPAHRQYRQSPRSGRWVTVDP